MTRREVPAETGADVVALLAGRVDELTRRVDLLESQLRAVREQRGPLPIDTILAISAAVAAYLGKHATVRGIRHSSSAAWAGQGRAAIHASHSFTHRPS